MFEEGKVRQVQSRRANGGQDANKKEHCSTVEAKTVVAQMCFAAHAHSELHGTDAPEPSKNGYYAKQAE